MSRVRIEGLERSFGGTPVLRGVDLDVADGEITAILGSSGCGKTTLLRIVAGFLDPHAGVVRLDERPVAGAEGTVRAQQRRVGYVPQEGALFPHLDVRANILFGLPRRERTDTRLAEMLSLAELPPAVARSFPHQLSGGQQQRVALARALAPRPRVVLLDEPFSSLDASLRASAGREVIRVLRAAGTTALMVTHDQGEALSLADRVAVMTAGRIAQVAPPAELYSAPVDVEVAAFVGGAAVLPAVLWGSRAACALGEVDVVGDPAADSGRDGHGGTGSARPAGHCDVLVRPEQVRLVAEAGAPVRGRVEEVAFFGSYATVRLLLDEGPVVTARVPAIPLPQAGDRVGVEVHGPVRVFT